MMEATKMMLTKEANKVRGNMEAPKGLKTILKWKQKMNTNKLEKSHRFECDKNNPFHLHSTHFKYDC